MSTPIIETRNLHKWYSGVHALKGVSLKIEKGQALGLVGDNGAGKSTLINILSGLHRQDEGEILLEGQEVDIRNPKDSMRLGIETIYQYNTPSEKFYGWGQGARTRSDIPGNCFLQNVAATKSQMNSKPAQDAAGTHPHVIWQTTFSSSHPGGAQFLTADGGVSFVSENVNLTIYRQMGVVNDGAPVGGGVL